MINILNLSLFIITIACLICQIFIIRRYKKLNNNRESEVATITHDLKTPVNALVNTMNLLLKGKFGSLSPEQYEIIQMSCGSGKYMSNLVGTIVTGYEQDHYKPKLNKTIFNIIEIINIVCCQNEYLAADKKQKIIFNTNTPICEIYADKLQIERVIYNLLSNAITYGFSGSEIILKLTKENNTLNFSITNKSYPISNKELKNIFKKFRKSSNSEFNCQSSGLGLYIAKRIIKQHKGNMYVYSSEDGIYTFGFTIKSVSDSCKINA